jgi:hypothetical protein
LIGSSNSVPSCTAFAEIYWKHASNATRIRDGIGNTDDPLTPPEDDDEDDTAVAPTPLASKRAVTNTLNIWFHASRVLASGNRKKNVGVMEESNNKVSSVVDVPPLTPHVLNSFNFRISNDNDGANAALLGIGGNGIGAGGKNIRSRPNSTHLWMDGWMDGWVSHVGLYET